MTETSNRNSGKRSKRFERKEEKRKNDTIHELRAIINHLRKENKQLLAEVERLKLDKPPKKEKPKKPTTVEKEQTEKDKKEAWRKDFLKRFNDSVKERGKNE